MTGYTSKKAAAQDKLITVKEHGATKYAHLLMVKCFTEEYDKHRRTTMDDDDDTQVYQDHDDALTIAYQSGYYDGKKAAQRPWVGLTDKERQDIALEVPIDAVLITEAKLKEKNS